MLVRGIGWLLKKNSAVSSYSSLGKRSKGCQAIANEEEQNLVMLNSMEEKQITISGSIGYC